MIPENEQNLGSIQNVQSCDANEIINMNEIICEHYHIKIDISSNIFSMILCYFCCCTGIITFAIGFLTNNYCELKCENLISLYKQESYLYFMNKYDLVGDQLKNARKIMNENQEVNNTIIDICYLKLQKPHYFTIRCEYCGKILKKGYNMGSLKGALFCGVIGLLTLILSAVFLYFKLR